jgi:hypothetical protein
MREFVLSHPDYKQDSIVPETTLFDLVELVRQRQNRDLD